MTESAGVPSTAKACTGTNSEQHEQISLKRCGCSSSSSRVLRAVCCQALCVLTATHLDGSWDL